MFLAWNEIKRNKLKFCLIIGVIILISFLLFLLSGLAKGLINMNTEGINKWNATSIVLNEEANQTVQQSLFDNELIEGKFKDTALLRQVGVIISNGEIEENALLFGTTKNSFLVPTIIEGDKFTKDNEVIVGESLKEKGFKVGDILTLSQSNEKLKIVGFSESAKYNASPTLFVNNHTIEKLNPTLDKDTTNALIVRDTSWDDVELDDSLEILAIEDFIETLPGYKEQNLTLNFMIGFLFVISATVIGVFLYVITLQKTNLFGVLKAQGFTNGYLARAMLSQTFILSFIGAAIGFLLTMATSSFLPNEVPIKLEILTLIIYSIVLIFVSLMGSLFSILTIRNIDPLEAIG